MVLVATSAVVIYCLHLNALSKKYRRLATFNAEELKRTHQEVINLKDKLPFIKSGCFSQKHFAMVIDAIQYRKLMCRYRAAMRAKYERAAERPWLPLRPDPPLPD